MSTWWENLLCLHKPIMIDSTQDDFSVGLLSHSLLSLMHIPEEKQDLFLCLLDEIQLGSFSLPDSFWDKSLACPLYRADPLIYMVSLSLDHFLDLVDNEIGFEMLIGKIKACVYELVGYVVTIDALPFVSDASVIQVNEINSLKDMVISDTYVDSDTVDRLNHNGIIKWSDLIGVSELSVFNTKEFCLSSLQLIRALHLTSLYKNKLLRFDKDLSSSGIQMTSFTETMRSWINVISRNNRNAEIIMRRLALGYSEDETLEEIGQRFGLTRERVRQIENSMTRSLFSKPSLSRIMPFWLQLYSILEAIGFATPSEIASELSSQFSWFDEPSSVGLIALLKGLPKPHHYEILECNSHLYIRYNGCSCHECEKMKDHLALLVSKNSGFELSFFLKEIASYCHTNCTGHHVFSFKPGLVAYVISNGLLRDRIRLQGDRLLTIDEWNLKYGKLSGAVLSLLKMSLHPLHVMQISSNIKALRSDLADTSEHNIYAVLDRCEESLLWGRGSYLHRDNIKIPTRLMSNIESWIIDQFVKVGDKLPFISIVRIFNEFEDQCGEAGIITDYALYTCLRIWDTGKLSYPHHPYVYPPDGYHREGSGPWALENYVGESGDPVSSENLKHYAISVLGFREFQLTQYLMRAANIVRSTKGYIHIDSLDIRKKELTGITSDIRKVLETEPHMSVHKIYERNIVVCRTMGIEDPLMLYDVLHLYSGDEFHLKYPQIYRLVGEQGSVGVMRKVSEYIKQKGAICTHRELEDYFVSKLGYNVCAISNAIYHDDDIFRYLQSCFVHRDALGFNEMKESELYSAALSEFDNAMTRGKCFALVTDLIELADLPSLSGDLVWTETLIADILNRSDGFRLLGTRKNAFVAIPNKFDIISFDSLLAYILRKEFGGATRLDTFIQSLIDQEIIIKQISSKCLEQCDSVSVIGQEIILRELVRNA